MRILAKRICQRKVGMKKNKEKYGKEKKAAEGTMLPSKLKKKWWN